MNNLRHAIAFALLLLSAVGASAQNQVRICVMDPTVTPPVCNPVTATAPLPTVASGTPSGTQDINLKQVAGAAVAQGHGLAATAIRVELPTDGTGLVTVNPATAANWGVGATASGVPANAQYNAVNVGGNLTGVVGDPCQTVAKTYATINITSATTTQLVAPSGSTKSYICHMVLQVAGANNIGVVQGTGGACSGATGLIGGTTAASGFNFVANGGVALGNGGYAVTGTGSSNGICLITSTTANVAGHIAWVQQ